MLLSHATTDFDPAAVKVAEKKP
nr:hypothetical protein [Frankia sp. QA3]